MNLINSAACELMLFLLRVAVWIIEIRVLREIWRDSQLQMAYYPISSRNSATDNPGRLPEFHFAEFFGYTSRMTLSRNH